MLLWSLPDGNKQNSLEAVVLDEAVFTADERYPEWPAICCTASTTLCGVLWLWAEQFLYQTLMESVSCSSSQRFWHSSQTSSVSTGSKAAGELDHGVHVYHKSPSWITELLEQLIYLNSDLAKNKESSRLTFFRNAGMALILVMLGVRGREEAATRSVCLVSLDLISSYNNPMRHFIVFTSAMQIP